MEFQILLFSQDDDEDEGKSEEKQKLNSSLARATKNIAVKLISPALLLFFL